MKKGTEDHDSGDELSDNESLLRDQREANEQMVSATIQAQELAEQAEAAKERAEESERKLRAIAEFREMFLGIVGHDLRNPLGSIVMCAGLLLQRGNLDDQDAKTVARIINTSQRMTRMIAQILDLTRARLGRGLPLDPKPTDLSEVCRSVVEEFEAGIQLEVTGDVTGNWDPDRLAEALSNITKNAIEHATPRTVVVVKAYADGVGVVVEISNRGTPIPEDLRAVIFEPFRRANEREKSATGNLGLGLYIAEQVALTHGGTLDVVCSGGTTTFVMRLPRHLPGGATS
jgi:signal transduction histidine kinase